MEEWASLLKTIVGAGLGTAFVQAAFSIYNQLRQEKKWRSYMASRIAVTLEFFACACADFILMNKNLEYDPDHEPDWTVELPELPPYPDHSDGWLAIDPALANKCLNLRNKIHESQKTINTYVQLGGDLEDTLYEEAAHLGVEAWKVADSLRRKHGLATADTRWNYAGALDGWLRDIEAKKQKGLERAAH